MNREGNKQRSTPSSMPLALLLLVFTVLSTLAVTSRGSAQNHLPAPFAYADETGGTGLQGIVTPAAPATPEPEAMDLPDLQTLPPTDLRIAYDEAGNRLLRFTNSIVNSGPAPLELRGEYDEDSQELTVRQHLAGSDETTSEPLEGTFIYQPEHNHYHWQNFAQYELWAVETTGRLSRVILSEDKVGFCLNDDRRVADEWLEENVTEDLEIPDSNEYIDCYIDRQGISVGWVDVYEYDLPGQALVINQIRDGVYALRSVADPDGVLIEHNRANNAAVLYFLIQDNDLLIIGEEFSIFDLCAGPCELPPKETQPAVP